MTPTIPHPTRDLPALPSGQLSASSLDLSRAEALRRAAAVFLIQPQSPQAGFVVLPDFSFASQGRISSNELDNFPTSSGARRQLSSRGLPLATSAGKSEFPLQRMLSHPLEQRAAPERVPLLLFALSFVTAEPLLLVQPQWLDPKDLDAIPNRQQWGCAGGMLGLEARRAESCQHPQLLQPDLKVLDPAGWREKYLLSQQQGAGFFQPEELGLLQSSQRGLLEGKGKINRSNSLTHPWKKVNSLPTPPATPGCVDPGRGQRCWRQNFQLGNTWKQEQGLGAFPNPPAPAAEGVSRGKGSFQVYGRDEPGSWKGTPGEGSATGKKCGNSSTG